MGSTHEQKIPTVAIVAQCSNSGKTTLIEKLLKEGKNRGWKMAVLKHDVHGFEMDKPGKDTWRHAQAGADVVVISSPQKIAILEKVQKENTLQDVLAKIKGVDLILIEGYKKERQPKIEIFRSDIHKTLLCEPEELLAVVSDIKLKVEVPCFDLNDPIDLCQFLDDHYGISTKLKK